MDFRLWTKKDIKDTRGFSRVFYIVRYIIQP